MRYTIQYNERVISEETLSLIKQCKQKIVKIELLTANDYPVGFSITLSFTPATEAGHIKLILSMGANYSGNNTWETP